MGTPAEEVASLEKVLTRLALTEDDNLQQVLGRLIPAVVRQLKTPNEATRAKVMEILGHVNKRLKSLPSLPLPLSDLVTMACDTASHPMVSSFALVYTEMAFSRASKDDRLAAVPALLSGIASRQAQPRQLRVRLALQGLEGLTESIMRSTALPAPVAALLEGSTSASTPAAKPTPGSGTTDMETDAPESASAQKRFQPPPELLARYPFLGNEEDRKVLLEAARKLLLYVPQVQSAADTPLQAAARVQADAAATAHPPAPKASIPGLSSSDLATLADKSGSMPSEDVLVRRKLGVLNLLAAGAASPSELVLPLLVASADPSDAVSRRGRELFKRICGFEGPRPEVDLEASPQLITHLFSLFLGTESPSLAAGLPTEQQTPPASAAVRSSILSLLCRSIASTALFPQTILVIEEAVFGKSRVSNSPRVRAQGMEFAVWVAKHCPTHQLKAMSGHMLEGLLRSLSLDASGESTAAGPPALDHASLELRGFAYQAVGCLAARVPECLAGRVDLARSFFSAVAEEPPGLRATVAEATAALSAAFKSPSPEHAAELDTLLQQSITSNRDAVRLCAVQWANRVFPLNHVPARWVCVLGTADMKLEVREEAAVGLLLSRQSLQPLTQGQINSKTSPAGKDQLPLLTSLLDHARQQCPGLSSSGDGNRALPLQPRSYLALLRFSEMCWNSEVKAAGQADQVAVPDSYLTLLEGALTRDATGELLSAALEALMAVAKHAPSVVEARSAMKLHVLQSLLSHVDNQARASVARLLGIAASGMTPQATEQLLAELVGSFGVRSSGPAAGAAAGQESGVVGAGSAPAQVQAHTKYEMQEGAIMAAGFVLADCLREGLKLPLPAAQATTASLLIAASTHPTPILAATAAQSLGYIGIGGGHAWLAALLSPASSPAPGAVVSDAAGQVAADDAAGGQKKARTDEAVSGAQLRQVLGEQLGELYSRVGVLMTDKDAKVATRGISAAGLLAWSWEVQPPSTAPPHASGPAAAPSAGPLPTSGSGSAGGSGSPRSSATPEGVALTWWQECLMGLATSKAEEVQFSAGESVALLFGGVPLPTSEVLRTPFTGLSATFALLDPSQATVATPAAADGSAMEVDGQEAAGASSPASSPARQVIQDSLLKKLLDDMCHHSRPEVRCTAAVWLVSLLTYTPRHPALLSNVGRIQEGLGGLLGDASELTQEMASRGVSIVYNLGDEQQKSQLVQALMGVLQSTTGQSTKVKLTGDTKVFDEGALGTNPVGGQLSTYRELCSLATELGQPDLVYRFMDLAHHQQALNTKRGAAFGFAHVAKLAGDALAPHVQQLVPKLYRYQYDPNPRVQDAMSSIWRALVSDPKEALDKAFPDLMRDLLKEMGGRLWRNRQASCGALADLVQGRRWPDLKPHLSLMWTMTFRVMDDIKESVRKAADSLARSMRGLTLRLCDKSMSSPSEAREATAVVLPIMLEQGLVSSVNEIRALSLDIVSKVAKTAGRDALNPLLPQLVQALLEGMSSLEDSRLNYLEQHAERLGVDAERLDNARSAAARASPLGDTLDLAANIAGADAEEGGCLQAVLPVLTDVMGRGVGLNTKTGCARFIKTMAVKAGTHIRSHAPTLIKALLSAIRREKSVAVRKGYAGAAAQVCKYSSDKRVDKVVGECLEWYGGNNSDSDTRLCSGLILRELLRAAPETFNAHAARILPLAFGARMDDDSSVAAAFNELWEEGCSSEAGALRLYSQEICSLLVEGLASQQWGRKKACAAAISALTKLGSEVLPAAAVCRLAGGVLAELPGRLWDGKEVMLAALGDLASAYPGPLGSELSGGHAVCLEAAVSAVQRKKTSYRAAGLTCLLACLTAFKADYYSLVEPVLLPSIQKHLQAPAAPSPQPTASAPTPAAAADASGAEEQEDKPLPLVDALKCLTQAFLFFLEPVPPTAAVAAASQPDARDVAKQVQDLAGVLAGCAGGAFPWQARLTAVQGVQKMCERAGLLGAIPAAGQGQIPAALPALRAANVQLCVPVAVCLEELLQQQVRTACLACLQSLLSFIGGLPAGADAGADLDLTSLPPDVCARVLQALQVVITSDKATMSVSAATKLKACLVKARPDVPVQMDT